MAFRGVLFSAVAVALGLGLSGCADPEGEFKAFEERKAANQGSGGTTACDPPAAGEADGDFLFALSATLAPNKPILGVVGITTTDGANGTEMSVNLQPLSATDRKTAVGTADDFGPYALNADGTVAIEIASLITPGEANPITGSEINASDVVLGGQVCGVKDFYCGTVTGNVTKPLPLDLVGSTFTLERITTPGTYPEPPKINCAGDLADPL